MDGPSDSMNERAAAGKSHDARQREDWLSRVDARLLREGDHTSEDLLGDYLPILADAATFGRRPTRDQLDAVHLLGQHAAETGISAGQGVNLYLSAARAVWDEVPSVIRDRDSAAVRSAAEAVLQVVEDAVAAFAEGHAAKGREMVRREETLRRELIDDLLRGDAHLGELAERAEPFGLDLTRSHQVALAESGGRLSPSGPPASLLERRVLDRFGDRDVLVTTKERFIVILVPADESVRDQTTEEATASGGLGRFIHTELTRLRRGSPWRVAVGRAHPGPYGIARSYEEARDGITTAARLRLDNPVVEAEDVLIYRVLFRDQPAIVDLVQSVLSPLDKSRGGARPLLDTLEAYFDSGCVATAAAVRLHLSVRAVTYRLARVLALTGHDPTDPGQRFTLQAAVLGAKLLAWPETELPHQALGH